MAFDKTSEVGKANTGSIWVGGAAEEVAAGTVVVPTGALTLSALTPTVILGDLAIAVPVGALSLTGFAPTVQTSDAPTITVPVGSLTLSGFAPVAQATSFAEVPVGALTLGSFAPTVDIGFTPGICTDVVPHGNTTPLEWEDEPSELLGT
jgi:hypothetical protein